jgi:hypothetical protein
MRPGGGKRFRAETLTVGAAGTSESDADDFIFHYDQGILLNLILLSDFTQDQNMKI